MEKRAYGKTGEVLSVVGFGGIVVMNEPPEESSRLVGEAIDRGINYFDVAPTYGNAQECLGPALEPYRKSVFLACKTEKRDAEESLEALHDSLQKLRTDYFDLYQLHAMTTLEEVDQVFGPGGAMETLVKAKEQGWVRYLGFSAHSEEAVEALLDRFEFTSILFPFNFTCWNQGNFGPRALAKAQDTGTAMLALKTLAKRRWKEGERESSKWPKCWYCPVETYEEARMALRFTLTRPITSCVSPSHADLLWWACDAAEEFTPIGEDEVEEFSQLGEGLDPIFPQERD
jgi:aryl-alcohol dehydrogenase-like predicted oxidoreductase